MELGHFRREGTPSVQVMRGGSELACGQTSVVSRTPTEVADAVLTVDRRPAKK